jgi:deferrochelatase/peroxidase EfeB
MVNPVIDYNDVQGTILRGYRVNLARHFILSITDPKATGTLIGALVNGSNGLPTITTASRSLPKPSCFLNISFTYPGLAALGVTTEQLATFDTSFQRGATSATTAATVGDVGASAPQNWIDGLQDGAQVHVLLSLWVKESESILESVSAQLRAAFAGCMTELYVQDANALPDNKVHFGYRDSIAQPTVIGAPPTKRSVPDDQPAVATGEFLLGYLNETGGSYTVSPPELSTNSSYAAFRVLEQDVVGFDAMLSSYAKEAGIDSEMLAAKICGRWRNGNPVELKPDAPGEVLPTSQLNNFTYVSADTATDDTLGLKCPIGSHIRRNNPRNEAVVGTDSTHHRIVRRAMPYGPAYDPAQPVSVPRGLIGYFINASVSNQFEFLTSQWNDLSTFVKSATGPGGSNDGNAVYNISGQDVFLGVNDPASSSFTLAGEGAKGAGNKTLSGFSRSITTRGGVYCFFPSIKGLLYLAGLPS